METTKKTSTKVLSLFLSVILALSCFTVALPGLFPGAAGAATTAQWTALKNAFTAAKNAGIMSGGNYGVSASGTSVTVTDDGNNYIWNIVVALQAVVAAERASYANIGALVSAIQNNTTGGSLNSYQKTFIASLMPATNGLQYTSGNMYYGQTKYTDNTNGADPGEPGCNYPASITSTVKVTRTLKSAILAQSSLPADNTNLQTSMYFTLTSTRYTSSTLTQNNGYNSSWSTGSGTDKHNYTAYHYTKTRQQREYFNLTGNSGASWGYTSTGTTLSKVRAYQNFVNAADFSNKYNQFKSNNAVVYEFDSEYLRTIGDSFNPLYNAAIGTDRAYLDKFCTENVNQKKFVDSCTGAYTASLLKPYVNWISTDDYHVTAGDIAHNDYTFTESDGVFGTAAEYAHIGQLLDQARSYLGIITSSTTETQAALAAAYGYNKADYEALIEELVDYRQLYELNNLYKEIQFRITHDTTQTYNGDASLFGVTDYESFKYEPKIYDVNENGVEVINKSNWPMSDTMEAAAKDWFNGRVSTINTYKSYNVTTVFQNPTFATVQKWANDLTTEYNYRNIETTYEYDYYTYFEPMIHGGVDYATKTDAFNEDAIAAMESKLASMQTAYNQAVSKIGQTKADQIYGTNFSYKNTVQAAIDEIYLILYNRCYDDHYTMVYAAKDHDDSTPADEITSANFSIVKRGIKDIDADLYNYVASTKASKYNSLIGSAKVNQLKTWHGWIPTYENKITQVMNAKWTGFTQIKLDSGSGTYTTRYVDDFGNDMVRDDPNNNGADKYVVTEAKINTVVTKLDGFVNSPDFTKLIGVYDADKGITSLGGFVDNLLTELVFSDDMVNMIIALLLPMVCDLMDSQVKDLLANLKIDGKVVTTSPSGGWSTALNAYNLILAVNGGSNRFVTGDDPDDIEWYQLNKHGAAVSINSGKIDLAYDGAQSTTSFPDEFHNLGLNIYPNYFGAALPSTVNGVSTSAFKSALSSASRSYGKGGWLYFDKINPTYTTVDKATGATVTVDRRTEENGATFNDGEITKDDLAMYKWGCKDFSTFTTALAAVFGCIEPLIKCLFTNGTYQRTTTNNFIKANANIDGRATGVGAGFIAASGDVHLGARGYGYATLTISGLQGYNDLWAPIFEFIGISGTTSSYDVSLSAPLSTTLGTAGNNATVKQIVNALIVPLYALINKLAGAPVSTLCSILPAAAMAVAYNMIAQLLDILALNINLLASINITDWDSVELWGWLDLAFLADLLSGTINDKLKNVVNTNIPVKLSDTVNDMLTEEELGFDITDFNSIANFIFAKMNEDAEATDDYAVSLPPINAGRLAQLGTLQQLSSVRSKNYNSSLGGKTRYFINARQSDVLYDLLQWVLDFIGEKNNLSGLMVTLGQDPLDADISTLLSGIDPEGALAALVELFVPQDYAFETYKWYAPNSSASTFSFGSSADFVYTMYGNDWTEQKAGYMYNELENVANSVIDMIDEDILGEIGVSGINELAQYYINSLFNNNGIMNVVKLVTGIGEGLAGEDFIVNLVKEQLQTGGADANIDLLSWYNTFGYLTYDYDALNDPELTADEKAELKALAPKKPAEAGYVNNFPLLSVTSQVATDEETGEIVYDDDGNVTYDYTWSYRESTSAPWQTLVDGEDNAREIFTHIFSELIRPLAPVLDLILTGTDLSAFAGSIVINGYDCYEGAVIPVLEVLGIKNLKTQAEFNAYSKANGSGKALDYLIDTLFDYVTDLLTIEADGRGPIQKLIDLIPRLFYFLQSDGLTTLIKNLLHPVWALVDTIRPIVNADIDGIVHLLLPDMLGLVYDKNDTVNYARSVLADFVYGLLAEDTEAPEYSAAQAAEDKKYVDAIYDFSIENLSLIALRDLVESCFGLDLTPIVYAFEGMCIAYNKDGKAFGVKSYASKGDTDGTWQPTALGWKELDFYGPDTITVVICAVLDLIRYKDNAEALDDMIGLVRELDEEGLISENFSAKGLLEALETIFEDAPVALTGDSPNWDYLLENKYVYVTDPSSGMLTSVLYDEWIGTGNELKYSENLSRFTGTADISQYHSLYQLEYVTDWTPEIADNIDEILSESLDYIVSLIDAEKGGATNLKDFVNNLLQENVFSGALLKQIADLIGKLYDTVPENVVDTIDNLLDIKLTGWLTYVKKQIVVDEDGNPVLDEKGNTTESYLADPDYIWWADPTADEYVDTDAEFYAAAKDMLSHAATLFGFIFLGDDYRLFRTMGDGQGSADYGDDAIVLNGLNAYSRGLIPILEAFGCDLSDYKPEKYTTDTDGVYNSELFVSDLFDIVKGLIDTILEDPYEYVISVLPNIVYFTNAGGFSTAITNIIGAVAGVLDTVNMMLEPEDRIGYGTLIEDIDFSKITLDTLFGLLDSLLGIHIREDLGGYIKGLYVGILEQYSSANGLGAFRMNVNEEYLDAETGRYKEGRGDFITILLSLIVEVLTDAGEYINSDGELVAYDNAAAIDRLIAGEPEEGEEPEAGMVTTIVNLLRNPADATYLDINWDYFDETLNLSDSAENLVSIKPYQFLYLNYTTDWTEAKADNVEAEFDSLLLAALKMIDEKYADYTDAEAIINDILDLDSFFTAGTLQKILDLVSPLLYGEDAVIPESILNLAGALLGADLSSWNYTYRFDEKDDAATYTADAETGLDYTTVTDATTGKTLKSYAITDRDSFINGLTLVLEPAYRLLAWILFNDGYEFFISNTDETLESRLLTIKGARGYKFGLALLLEAFGIDEYLQEEEAYLIDYNADEGTYTGVDMAAFMSDVLRSVCVRMDEIIANPVGEIENLIAELLYFINAGGLQTTIRNLAGAVLNLLDAVSEAGLAEVDIDSLLEGVINDAVNKDLEETDPEYKAVEFSLDNIDLEYVFSIVELFTGLTINEVVGNSLEYFKIGQVYAYPSATRMLAYKMRFTNNDKESFADFVTVLLSFVIDIFEYEGNAEALEKLLKLDDGILVGIAKFLRESYTVKTNRIDWFYFDADNTLYNADGTEKDPAPEYDEDTVLTVTETAINYLSYKSNWTKDSADVIYKNRNELIASALKLLAEDEESAPATLGDLIAEKVDLNEVLYTKENVQKILDLIKGLTEKLDPAILDLIGIIVDVDLNAFNDMTAGEVTDKTSFANELASIIKPVARVLDWLLFADDIQYFDKKTETEGEYQILVNLPGADGYNYALVPILEALGVVLPATAADASSEDVLFALINNVLARVETILANPVDEVLALLPNLIYFVNTNALATCVGNLLSPVVALLDEIGPTVGIGSVDELIASLFEDSDVEIDINKLDWLAIFTIVEGITGLEITDVLTSAKIDKFFFGGMSAFDSANGHTAFRMDYSATQDPADMLTFIVNLLIEVLMYKDTAAGINNAKTIDELLATDGVVESVIAIFTDAKPVDETSYYEPDWNYFKADASATLGDIEIPTNKFVYLDYANDWTYEKAAAVTEGLNDIIADVLVMAGSDAKTVSDLLAGVLPLDDYLTADNLNAILAKIAELTAVIDETLATVINVVIGSDFSTWTEYTFKAAEDLTSYEYDAEAKLYYSTDADGFTTYAVNGREDFVYGICKILEPIENILAWVLLGDSYGFFVDNATGERVLLNLYGADGYDTSIALLLEALGCEDLPKVNGTTTTGEIMEGILLSVLSRIDEIMADPINEVIDLIPELIYFINAHGLHAVINNLTAGLKTILANLEPITGFSVEIDALLTELVKNLYIEAGIDVADDFVLSTKDIDLAYVIEIAEAITGLDIAGALGTTYGLEKLVIGNVVAYDSASRYDAYRMQLADIETGLDAQRDRADVITILLSLVLDVVMYKDADSDNAAVIDSLAKLDAGTVDAVAALLKAHTVETTPIDWFYFDDTVDASTVTAATEITMPERTINYIEYTTDWTEETADYISDNLDAVIAAVLQLAGAEETSVAALLEQQFTLDELYTAENLNGVISKISEALANIGDSVLEVAGVLLECDLASYKTMSFTEEEVYDRVTFENALGEALAPIYNVLDWLFFGDDIDVFYNNEAYGEVNGDGATGYDIISISGAEGYAYGLVPVLEAIGIELPAYVKGVSDAASIIPGVITGVLDFAEKVLADPVNQVLAIVPNLLYFINANGAGAAVQNLLGSLTCLLADVSKALDKLGVDTGDYDLSDVQALVDSLLAGQSFTVDVNNVDLGAICDIVTAVTGIALRDVVVDNGLENFFLGKVEYFESSTGNAAFRMVYTDEEGRAELLTILVNFLLDVAMYQDEAAGIDNPAVIDKLAGTDGTVKAIVELIKRLGSTSTAYPYEVDWNYFEGTVEGTLGEKDSVIVAPATPFGNYLTYVSDWTKETANYLYNNLDAIAAGVLSLIDGIEADTVAELISGVNLYQGKYLNSIVEAIQKLFFGNEEEAGLPEALLGVIDAVLGTDINGWKELSYPDGDLTASEFVNALEDILYPAYPLLDWLLFGDDLEYFVQDKSGETLVTLSGSEGYATGLAVILEALGVELPEYYESTASCETMMKGILTAVTVRIAEIFNDPVNEVLELIPNLLYYINTAGVSVALRNLLGAVGENITEIGKLAGIDGLTFENVGSELLGIDLNLANLDLNEIIRFVENLDALKGLKIAEVFTGTISGDSFVQDPAGDDNLIENFYLGNAAAYQSSTGYTMYKMAYTDENKGDLITMLLSFVLQVAIYEGNAAPLAALTGVSEETVIALVQILTSGVTAELADINWTYYLGLEDKDAIEAKIRELAADATTAINGIQIERTSNYLKYTNNWNEETASYLTDNLAEIADLVINLVTDSEYADLASLLNSIEVINNLYSDATVDLIVSKIANALNGVIEKSGTELFTAAGDLLSVDILAVANYQSTGVYDKATFAKSLADAFSPLGELLDWLLFGRDYEFFTKLENGEKSIIKLNGGEGFKYGLAPILAALGVDTHIEDLVAAADPDKSVTGQVLAVVLENVCDVIDDILADPVNEVIALVPELIYFINASGAQVCVNNLLAPVNTLLAEAGAALGMDGTTDKKDITSVSKLANLDILDNLSFEGICALVKDKTGIDVWGAIGGYIDTFYFGQLTHYTSYDGIDGFTMEYSDTEEAHDFVTVLLTMVLDVATYEGNDEFFIDLLDESLVADEDKDENKTKATQMYYAALALLTNNYEMLEMQDFDWLFVTKDPVHPEWIDTGVAISPLMTGSEFEYLYGPLYKREMGEYITKWLPDFIDTMIVLLGIEGANGDIFRSFDDLLEGLLGDSIYTNDILYTLLDALQSLYPTLANAIGEDLTAHAAQVLKDCLGVDLTYWNDYTTNAITDGDRDGFVNEIVRMLRPAYPLLKWLLIEGEDIAFFTTGDDGSDYIVLKGADGYAYSIVPILEALHCEDIVSPAEFKAQAEDDTDTMLLNILNPLLDRVDEIFEDPINEILDVATSAIYFMNSNALDTCFKNLLNAVYSLLNTIEPITGEINVYELIGLDLSEMTIESIVGELLENLEEEYGFSLKDSALEAVKELTVGYLRSYTSLNGRQAYTMDYAEGGDQTDLVTVILRFAMTFIADPANVPVIEEMLVGKLSDSGYEFVCALLDNFATMVGDSAGMDTVLYTIYYIFYSANVAAHETENWIAEFNGNFSFLDQLFATSDLAFLRQLEKSLGGLLNKWTDQVINDDGIMTDGVIPFFTRILDFFKKIINFFKSIFGLA